MKSILIFVLFLVPFSTAFAQCLNQYPTFKSQSDIDNFPKNYPDCDSFGWIVIENISPITNFDSLIQLRHIDLFHMRNLINLESTKGLNNLESMGEALIEIYPTMDTFINLQKVDYLRIKFPDDDKSLDLSIFSNVTNIDRISILGSGRLKGLPKFNSSEYFSLSIVNNKIKNNVSNLLPENQIEINGISITRSDSIIIDDLKRIEICKRNLFLVDLKHCDVRNFNQIKSVSELSIYGMKEDHNNIFKDAYFNVSKLDIFIFGDNAFDLTFYDLVPNLKQLNSLLHVSNNKSFVPLGFFDEFAIPKRPYELPMSYDHIYISNNSNIIGCNSRYLCDALQTYPDSVFIEGNGADCTIDKINEYCLSSTDEDGKPLILLYPNPVNDFLYLSEEYQQVFTYRIYLASGDLALVGEVYEKGEIDVSGLPSGIYTVECINDERILTRQRFMKL